MPEIPDRREQFALKYDNMEDEQLRDILRADASKPEGGESDVDEIFYVMELLARRRSERGEARDPAEALEAFKKRYPNDLVVDEEDEACSEKVIPYSGRSAGWKRRLVAVTAAAALIAVGVMSAGAAKFNLWEAIARWTQETFRWGAVQETDNYVPTPDKQSPCADLLDMLRQNDIPTSIVPTWLPDGFVLSDMQVIEQPDRRIIYAQFENGEKYILIQIHDYLNENPAQFEQSGKDLRVYSKNEIQYYIFPNNEATQIVWTVDHFECEIQGIISVVEAKQMIDSIMED